MITALVGNFEGMLNKIMEENWGLSDSTYADKMRMAIALLLLSKEVKSDEFKKLGLQLLNRWTEDVFRSNIDPFGTDLAVIGWTIEWLAQTGLLEDVNTDEILEDVDDVLYKVVVSSVNKDGSFMLSASSILRYFTIRPKSLNSGTHRYRQISHQECIVLLVGFLNELENNWDWEANAYTNNETQNQNRTFIGVADLGHTLISIAAVKGVDMTMVQELLRKLVEFAEHQLTFMINELRKEKSIKFDMFFNYLYLASCYLIAALSKRNFEWKSRAKMHIGHLLSLQPQFGTPHFDQQIKKMNVFALLSVYFPKTIYRQDCLGLIRKLTEQLDGMDMQKTGGHIIISQLMMENPRLISDWYYLAFAPPHS